MRKCALTAFLFASSLLSCTKKDSPTPNNKEQQLFKSALIDTIQSYWWYEDSSLTNLSIVSYHDYHEYDGVNNILLTTERYYMVLDPVPHRGELRERSTVNYTIEFSDSVKGQCIAGARPYIFTYSNDGISVQRYNSGNIIPFSKLAKIRK